MIKINMKSSATVIKGQGVGSCYEEQVALIKGSGEFQVTENGHGNFDIIHYHTVNPGYYLDRLLRKNKAACVGYVHFLPNTLDESLQLPFCIRKIFYKYILAFYNGMDYLVTVNPYFIKEIRRYGITQPEVLCIPNFVDDVKFHPLPRKDIESGKIKFNIDLHKFVVLGVGQLQTRKGIADFIETAKHLPDVQFIWAGGFSFGKLSNGYREIKGIVNDCPDNIRFLGIIERKEMNLLYNISDLFFLPSYDELFPMSILEALCCKIPIMVRDVSLYDDILFDCCLRGSSAAEFADGISIIANNEREYSKWSEKAWECHCKYTKEQALKNWTGFYSEAYSQVINKEKLVFYDKV